MIVCCSVVRDIQPDMDVAGYSKSGWIQIA